MRKLRTLLPNYLMLPNIMYNITKIFLDYFYKRLSPGSPLKEFIERFESS